MPHSDREAHQFTLFVNGREFQTSEHQLTGLQIKAMSNVPGDYELFRVTGDQTVPVGNEEVVHIANKMHFRAIPAGTFGKPWHYRHASSAK